MTRSLPEIREALRRATGLLLGVGALVAAAVTYVRLTQVLGMHPGKALVDPFFAGTSLVGIAALSSVFVTKTVGRNIQLSVFFLASAVAAVTGYTGAFAPIAPFCLFLAYAVLYLEPTRNARRALIITGSIFLTGWVLKVIYGAGDDIFRLVGTLLAGGVLAALLAILVHSVQTIQTSQKEILENRIAESTKDLEAALAQSNELLIDNRVLLRELHHRTKNNLQVVASLLSLRQTADEASDPGCRKVIENARNHVYSMAMIHELFHASSSSQSSVLFSDFLEEVVELWKHNRLVTTATIELDGIRDMAVSMDFAIHVVLVLNELISNISEHGYPDTAEKPVEIRAISTDDRLQIEISDRGVGFPEHISLDRPRTTGLQIIVSLVKQLQGRLDVSVDHGSRFTLTLPNRESSN